jgi:hypothetical protein
VRVVFLVVETLVVAVGAGVAIAGEGDVVEDVLPRQLDFRRLDLGGE